MAVYGPIFDKSTLNLTAIGSFVYIYGMRNILFILFLFTVAVSYAQSDALAKNYFEQGQFEKS